MYEGMWIDDLAKCGQMKDWNRDSAPDATQFPLPPVSIVILICVIFCRLKDIFLLFSVAK